MIQQGRNELGKFSSKSDENRQVRSIRLTDTAWNALGDIADNKGITRADLIEIWMGGEYFNLINKLENLEMELESLKYSSLNLSSQVLKKLDKVVSSRSITREELINSLLDSYLDNEDFKSSEDIELKLIPNSFVKSNINIQPLNNKNLAKRFNIDPSNLRKQRLKGYEKFLAYSIFKDPEGISWQYSENDKLYYPIAK